MHVIAAKAVALRKPVPQFRRYQKQVVANSRTLAQGVF